MNAFKRSLELLKLSVDVMKKDKELLLFPIIGGIFSLLFILVMLFPTIISGFIIREYFFISIFFIYLGLVFISIFFNVCAVYTIKKRFDGKNATFFESIKFALSKTHLILGWALISAIIGLLLRLLEDTAERMGETGKIIIKIMVSIIGVAWSLVASFVVPGMVYNNTGPIKALKNSATVFKKTWGESLIRYYGLGLIQTILIVIGVITTLILAFLTIEIPVIPIIIIVLGIIYIIAVLTFFNIANSVFNTALYVYATTGKAPKGYREDILRNAFEKNKE